jgi:hypothetical protein
MDKLEIKQGSFIQQTQYFIPVEIGTRFLHSRGTSPLKEANPVGTLGYRNGTESFFSLKGRPSVVLMSGP